LPGQACKAEKSLRIWNVLLNSGKNSSIILGDGPVSRLGLNECLHLSDVCVFALPPTNSRIQVLDLSTRPNTDYAATSTIKLILIDYLRTFPA
jgi:hypothetical protein